MFSQAILHTNPQSFHVLNACAQPRYWSNLKGHTTELLGVSHCFLCVVDCKPILQAPNILQNCRQTKINAGFPMPNSQCTKQPFLNQLHKEVVVLRWPRRVMHAN